MLRSRGSRSSDNRPPQRPPRIPIEQQQPPAATSQQPQQRQHLPGGGGSGGTNNTTTNNSGGGGGGAAAAISTQSSASAQTQQQQQQQVQLQGQHQYQHQQHQQHQQHHQHQHQHQHQQLPASSSASSNPSFSSDPLPPAGDRPAFDIRASQQFQKKQFENFDQLSQQQPQQQQHQQNFAQRSPVGGGGGSIHSPKNAPRQFLLQHQQQQHSAHPADPSTAPDFESSQFANSVSRSQSRRYPQLDTVQQPRQYGLQQPASLEEHPQPQGSQSPHHLQHSQLRQLPAQGAPLQLFQQEHEQEQQQQQDVPPSPQPKQSGARKLIKSLLGRTGVQRTNNSTEQAPQNSPPAISISSSLKRHSSTRNPIHHLHHRTSPPSSLRTGPSQVSLEQSSDWPGQQQQPSSAQRSPLQPVSEFTIDPRFSADLQQLQLQQQSSTQAGHSNTLDQHSTICPVPGDPDGAQQYQDDELRYSVNLQQQQDYHHQQRQFPPQQPYGEPSDLSQLQEQYQDSPQGHYQQQPPTGTQPQFVGQSTTSQHRNPETVSQLSHESPLTDPDQRSNNNLSTQASPAVAHSQHAQDIQDQGSRQAPPPLHQQTMPTGQGASRRADVDDAMRGQGQDLLSGPPAAYRQGNRPPPTSSMSPLPPTPSGSGAQNPNFRPDQRYQAEDQQQQQQHHRAAADHGRNSPQPAGSEPVQPDKEMKELVTKYKNVKRLYFDGKSTIDQLTAQIEQLQNAIANQRMSQSRTMLDDNEYIKLFDRLNGAINNLSFNIRKDWRALPQWVERFVSADALKTGKQEMTAVGRAVISCWVTEEVFNKCFHPALDPVLSLTLKEIELNIRRCTYTMNMQEEQNALTAKIVSWRMATLDGLDRKLNSPSAGDHFAAFTTMATTNLTAYLFQYLTEPPPPGIEGSVTMIVELAIKIASNIPMESRDVAIIYPMPDTVIRKDLMEVEKTPLPALPGADDDSGSIAEEGGKDKQGRAKGPPMRDPSKVRIAGFITVEVRGKHHLYKAPVWTLG